MPIKKTLDKSKPRLVASESKKSTVPLILEPHPRDYSGFPFITLIQYRKHPMLVIVDNADDESIKAYVLDMCGPERVDEEMIIFAANEWYVQHRGDFPISIEFSRRGMTGMTSKIYRALNIEFISRVIGPVPKYSMVAPHPPKRRRRKSIPDGIEITSMDNVILAEELFK